MYKLDVEEVEEPEIKLPTSMGSQKKQVISKKTCFIEYAKATDCVDHHKLWKNLRDGNMRSPFLPPEKSVCRSRSNS